MKYISQLEKMKENYEILKKSFKSESSLSHQFVALCYTMQNKILDPEGLKEVKSHLKNNTKALSAWRGMTAYPICGMLTSSDKDPIRQLDKMIEYYPSVKAAGFKTTTYLPSALYALTSTYEAQDIEGYSMKAFEVYQEMKKNHPILTSGDDYAMAMLLASSDNKIQTVERYYNALSKEGFSKSNGLQRLSHILSFSDLDFDDTVTLCSSTYQFMKKNKLRISTEAYAALGILTLVNSDSLLNDLVELTDYLKANKPFKWLSRDMQVLIASTFISSYYLQAGDDVLAKTSLHVSIQSLLAAQHVAMMVSVNNTVTATTFV